MSRQADANVPRPKTSSFHKSDLNRWRELFDLYLQAGIFFSTNEFDHGSRTSAMAAQKLQWFQSEVVKRDIMGLFKLKASHAALQQFIKINLAILQNLKFQEINQRAITKILKSEIFLFLAKAVADQYQNLTRGRISAQQELSPSLF